MYPVWAFVTAVPIYIGLQESGDSSKREQFWWSMFPCGLLLYGLCIMGGGLHSAFSFLTVLPIVYHDSHQDWSDLDQSEQFGNFLASSQSRIVQHIFVGCLPGIVACNVASIWMALTVHFRPTRFPKWFNFFNPLVTSIWVQILGALLPDPVGLYFVGCLGTWGLLVLNLATTFILRSRLEENNISEHYTTIS